MTAPEYEVFFHLDAQAEALDAAEYIATHSPRNAKRWYAGLERAIASLSRFPHRCAFALEAEYLQQPLRHYVYKSHRIIFAIDEAKLTVRVLHVRHSAQRPIGEPGEGERGDPEKE